MRFSECVWDEDETPQNEKGLVIGRGWYAVGSAHFSVKSLGMPLRRCVTKRNDMIPLQDAIKMHDHAIMLFHSSHDGHS